VQAAAQAFLHPDQAVILVVGDKQQVYHKLEPLSSDKSNAVMELDENGKPWQEDITPVSDRTADEVIEAYLKAIGGRSHIALVEDLRRVMTAPMGGMELTVTEWYGPGRKYRSEARAGTMVMEEVILDGTRAGRKGTESQEELTDVDLQDLQFNAAPVPELDFTGYVDRKVLAGRTTVNGKEAYKVLLMTQHGTTVADYFDVTTGLKLQRTEQKFMMGRNMRVTTTYGDYRTVGGVQFPHSITQGGGAMGMVSFTVKEIVVNKGTIPGFFETGLPEIVEPTEYETDPEGGLEGQ